MLTRRQIFQFAGRGVAGLACAGVAGEVYLHTQIADATAVQMRHFELQAKELFPGKKWTTEQMRIAQIADLHLAPYNIEAIRKALALVFQAHPDMLLIPGDFADKYHHDQFSRLLEQIKTDLQSVTGAIPTVFEPGNHDYKDEVLGNDLQSSLEKLGIHFVRNCLESVFINGQRCNIFASGSMLANDVADIATIANRDAGAFAEDAPTLVLAHEPTSAVHIADEAVRKDIPLESALYLSGHTHGASKIVLVTHIIGQILRIFDRSIFGHDTLYNSGLYQFQGNRTGHILTTNGIGTNRRDRTDLDPIVLGTNKRIAPPTVEIVDIAA